MSTRPTGLGWEPFGMSGEHIVWRRSHPEELLTSAQVRSLLGVSISTVKRWVRFGRLPAPLRVGRSLRWRAVDLYLLLEGPRA